jgi:AcrR family transcriptional regulator
MAVSKKADTTARKAPRQARAQVTVDAIFDATIQVLLSEGLPRLTTLRVAERAGASIGTLYQYYPNKQALLFAVLQRHVHEVGEHVGLAAESVHHTPLETMVRTVVAAFVEAKTSRMDEARALSGVAADLNARSIVRDSEERGLAMLTALLGTATDVQFDDLPTVVYLLMAAMLGPTLFMIDGGAPPSIVHAWSGQLQTLCLSYLERVARKR